MKSTRNKTAPDGQASRNVPALEERVGHVFADKSLAREALTHASHFHEHSGDTCNERLEFLGDAVLGMIVGEALFRAYPKMSEGGMSKAKAAVVSADSLAGVALEAGFPELLIMSPGTERTGGRRNKSILSDAVEAVIAALYLDAGIDAARDFILPRLTPGIAQAASAGYLSDNKTRLQELLQRKGEAGIEYVLEEASGPPHERTFTVALNVNGRRLAMGRGRSKKDAQQQAAGIALEALQSGTNESGNEPVAPEKT